MRGSGVNGLKVIGISTKTGGCTHFEKCKKFQKPTVGAKLFLINRQKPCFAKSKEPLFRLNFAKNNETINLRKL